VGLGAPDPITLTTGSAAADVPEVVTGVEGDRLVWTWGNGGADLLLARPVAGGAAAAIAPPGSGPTVAGRGADGALLLARLGPAGHGLYAEGSDSPWLLLPGPVAGFDVSPTGEWVAVALDEGTVSLQATSGGEAIAVLPGTPVRDARFSASGTTLYVAARPGDDYDLFALDVTALVAGGGEAAPIVVSPGDQTEPRPLR
jgi:hypothetical protein